MWTRSLNCLCYNTRNKVGMSRKCESVYVKQVRLLLGFLICFASFWNFCAAEVESPEFEKTYNSPLADGYFAAPVNNVAAEYFYSEEHRKIRFNVSWEHPTETRSLESYRIQVNSLNQTGHCSAASGFESFTINKNHTNAIIPEPDRDLYIIPECQYRIEVQSEPHDQDIQTPYIDYTVPECVGLICSCKYDLPSASFNITQESEHFIRVLWSVNASSTWLATQNLTKVTIVLIFVSDTIHKRIATIARNITNDVTKAIQEDEININSIHPGTSYDVHLKLQDNRSCEAEFYGRNFRVKIYQQVPWVYTILVPCMSITMIIGVACFIICKSRCCLCLKKLCFCYHQPYNQPQIRRIYRPVKTEEYELKCLSIPTMQRNNLYIEKEILEEIARGKADKYEICYARLKIGEEIGGGAFGQVSLATVVGVPGIPDHSTVAVKKLKKTAAAEELDEFLDEIGMLKKIGYHPNIVKLIGCCTIKQPYCMVMEYVPCGDLLQYLRALRVQYEQKGKAFLFSTKKNSGRDSQKSSDCSYITPEITSGNRLPSLTETEYTMLSSLSGTLTPIELQRNSTGLLEYVLDPKELQNFALQIAQGMSYLEMKQIVHRDLAARNVLIHKNKTLKISDFGLSRSGIYVNTKHKKVPLRWLSVEAIRDNLYTCKSDVWAYSIVLWEIGTLGGFPYPTVSDNNILPYLLQGKRLEKPENCTDEFYAMMQQCWSHYKDQRPTFEELADYLNSMPKNRKIYVDFSQLNPLYVFPPTEEQTVTQNRSDDSKRTIETVSIDS